MNLLCPWEPAQYLIFSSNVPPLLYYSHLPAIIAALALGIYIWHSSRGSSTKIVPGLLLTMIGLFSFYSFIDLVIWATNNSEVVIFWWSIQILLEVLVYATALYLTLAFLHKRDVSMNKKYILFALVTPLAIWLPTKLTLSGIDLSYCDAVEGFAAKYYSYFVEIVCIGWIVVAGIKKYLRAISEERQRILYWVLGIVIFLSAFSWGNLIGSFTGDWNMAQYGFFGMPVFLAFLTYSVVRFKMFNVRMFTTQALMLAFWALLGSLLFIFNPSIVRIVVGITLLVSIPLGIMLIRSVRREIEQREELERLTKDLSRVNARLKELDRQKTQFLSIASHQFRSPLTAIKGYGSMMLDDTYGEIPDKLREPIERMFKSANNLAIVVEDFLNLSRIELGRMKYEYEKVDLAELVDQTVDEQQTTADSKNLALNFVQKNSNRCLSQIDRGKMKQVVTNLIDNAIKYTKQGSVTVTLDTDSERGVHRIVVEDTGVGIPKENLGELFEQFVRARNAHKVNASGTGLGLYIAKQIVKAHNGKIWAESDGEGKGSTFVVELKAV